MTCSAEECRSFLARYDDVAFVEVETAVGSTPREAGAWMVVAAEGVCGTIGGGQLEYRAIEAARGLLAVDANFRTLDMALGPVIGQCCGGRVVLSISGLTARSREDLLARVRVARAGYPAVYVFGAGHVGQALARALRLLPVRLTVVDMRDDALSLLPDDVERICSAVPESVVSRADAGSAFIVLTHDHGLDFLIASTALLRGDARYVGMIGSKTKRASFASWCRANIDMPIDQGALVCPVGAQGSDDKRPEVLAAFVAAEVVGKLTASSPRPAK